MLKKSSRNAKFSWTNKASLYKLLDIAVDIPVRVDGHLTLKKQEEIVPKV